MTDPHAAPAHLADPIAAAEAAVALLRTGRTTMALTLLEGLPDQVRAGDAAQASPPAPTAVQLAAAEVRRLRTILTAAELLVGERAGRAPEARLARQT